MPGPRVIPPGPAPTPTAPIPPMQRAVTADRGVGFMRLVGDLQVHVVVRLSGHVEEARLARAHRLLLDVEPVLGCRYVEDGRRPLWARLPGLETIPACDLLELPGGERAAEAEERAVVAYLASPPDSAGMPMLRVRIFRAPDHDTLALKVNHLVADGGGSKELAYRLAALYAALGETPHLDPTPNLTGRRSMRQVAEQLGFWGRLKLLPRAFGERRRRMRPARHWRPPDPVQGPRGAEAPGRTYAIHRLDGPAFRRLKAWGQARGATVNDCINAAYLHALVAWLRPAPDVPLRLRTTVDLRRYLPGGRTEAVCNCSSFTYPNIGPLGGGEADLSALVHRMAAEMREWKAGPMGLAEWAIAAPMLRLVSDRFIRRLAQRHLTPEKQPEAYTPALTNIGRIHGDRLRFGEASAVDAFATASVIYPPSFAACVTGFGESLTISAGFCEVGLPQPVVDRLFAHMVEQLSSVG